MSIKRNLGQSKRDRSVWELGCVIFLSGLLQCCLSVGMKRGNCLSQLPRRTFYRSNKIWLCVAGIRCGTPPPTRIRLSLRLSPHSSCAMGNKGIKFTPNEAEKKAFKVFRLISKPETI